MIPKISNEDFNNGALAAFETLLKLLESEKLSKEDLIESVNIFIKQLENLNE